MGDVFQAGSAVAQLRAEVDEFEKGFDKAGQRIQGFGEKAQKAGTAVSAGGAKMSQGLADIDRKTALMNSRFALFSSRVLSMQLAFTSLGGVSGPLGQAFESVAKGANAAGAAFHATSGKIGLLNASILGIGIAALDLFTLHLKEVKEATDESTKTSAKSLETWRAYQVAIDDANQKATVFRATLGERLPQALSIMESAFSANQKRLRQLPAEIAAIRSKIDEEIGVGTSDAELAHFNDPLTRKEITNRGGSFTVPVVQKLIEQFQALQTLQGNLIKQQDQFAKQAPFDQVNAEVVKMNESLQKTRDSLIEVQAVGEKSLILGVADSADVAAQRLEAARRVLEQMLKDNERIRALAFSGAVPTDQIEAFLKQRLHSESDIGAAAGGVKDAFNNKASIDASRQLASSFSNAVASGLQDAILNARTPMQGLAALGNSLFQNLAQNFTQNIAKGLQSVLGDNGAISGLLTGVLGIAGGILSRRNGKGSQSFNHIKNAVDSTQLTRGVVAGDRSVAIENVAEDIGRAFEPSRQLLAEIRDILRGGATVGISPRTPKLAGSVATT